MDCGFGDAAKPAAQLVAARRGRMRMQSTALAFARHGATVVAADIDHQ